jgi:predicted hydrocarbon binding protein
VLTTSGAPVATAADCRTVIGWHRKALEICGAKDVEVVEEECRANGSQVCRYRVSWQ